MASTAEYEDFGKDEKAFDEDSEILYEISAC